MSIFTKIKSSLINRMETLEQRKINHLINKKRSIKYNDIDMTFFVPNALNRYRVKTFATKELDDYLQKAGVKYVDLLKIDTQGFEPEVLEGTGELLQNVDVVLTELMFYDYYERSLSFSDIEKYLLPAGFTLYDINHIPKNPMNGRTDWVDVIYVNRKVLEEAL